MTQAFKDFAYKVARGRQKEPFDGLILSFDPGETTGFCIMRNFNILILDQLKTPKTDVFGSFKAIRDALHNALASANIAGFDGPVQVSIEDYRIYDWKSDEHKWSQVHTIKVVGFCEALARARDLPVTINMASAGKHFYTDERLKQLGLYDETVGKEILCI